MKVYEFDSTIIQHPSLNSGYVEFPFDVEKEFGTRGQVKVIAAFDGYEYRGSLAKMGLDCHIIGLTQKVRSVIHKNPGDTVHVVIKQDVENRTVEIPKDFMDLLERNPEAKDYFNKLSYTNRKEYVLWITGAKKSETRERRLLESIEKLSKGIKLN